MAGVGVAGVTGIWQKLRRRKVVQCGVAYCAAGWVLLQAMEYATSTFHWPQSIQQHATLTFLAGLPIVLLLAWYHGDRGEQHFQRSELALITLLVVLGGGLVWRYEPATDASGRADASRRAAPAASTADTRPAQTGPHPVVAVLHGAPFLLLCYVGNPDRNHGEANSVPARADPLDSMACGPDGPRMTGRGVKTSDVLAVGEAPSPGSFAAGPAPMAKRA